MYSQKEISREHFNKLYLNAIKYVIREYARATEGKDFRVKYEVEVTGLDYALQRAETIINIALNRRRMSSREKRELRENMKYDLVGWYITIERK